MEGEKKAKQTPKVKNITIQNVNFIFERKQMLQRILFKELFKSYFKIILSL